jgi:hypothetical protein
MKKTLVPISLFALVSVGGCYASTIFGSPAPLTGSLTASSGEIIASPGYSGATVSWTITPDLNNSSLLDYTYVVSSGNGPALSHFILSLSSGCMPGASNFDSSCVGGISSTEFGTYTSTSNGNSNIGLPAGDSITGVKFNTGSTNSTTYSFTSDHMPVYGDFYFKGGQEFAYDAGLANPATATAGDFIARPDSTPVTCVSDCGVNVQDAPEPGSLLMLCSGMILCFGFSRVKRTR